MPGQPHSREVLLSFAECALAELPSDVMTEVADSARIASSAKIIEDLFNFVRLSGEGNRSQRQSPEAVWHLYAEGPDMAEADLGPIAITAVDEAAATGRFPPGAFQAANGEADFSLGPEVSRRFLSGESYPSFSVERHMYSSLEVKRSSRPVTPKSHTQTYNPDASGSALGPHCAALALCARWCWAVHVERGGAPPDFDRDVACAPKSA